ncbi:MAG: septum formation initiator family protein [Lachnospiraceae bacterium]|jgi:cell division protein DivIC|nr:septum formation initiator family protein [Lachnospiraceae bacterium]
MRGIIFVVLVLMTVLLVQSSRLNKRIEAGDQQISELQSQTESEEKRTDEIKDLQSYMQSDEYKEQVAKDKLGMVKDGEIIFKESD